MLTSLYAFSSIQRICCHDPITMIMDMHRRERQGTSTAHHINLLDVEVVWLLDDELCLVWPHSQPDALVVHQQPHQPVAFCAVRKVEWSMCRGQVWLLKRRRRLERHNIVTQLRAA
jgi:hypothetical protein